MEIPPIITAFTDDDLYKFTMCCAVIDNYPRAQVRYRFTDRDNRVYPEGFAAQLRRQVDMLASLAITPEEIAFMKRRCPYLPYWFYDFLNGFRYDPSQVSVGQDAEGHLSVEIEGPWYATILFEVKLLAIISELYYIMRGDDSLISLDAVRETAAAKGRRLIEAGCSFSDMGTRRRASAAVHDVVVGAMAAEGRRMSGPGEFVGTSNIRLAMKYDVVPIGTMAHELVCAMAGMYGPQMANYLTMQAWTTTFNGALGTFLYDTYGWRIFSLNFSEAFANMFKGLRVDSGDNLDQLHRIVEKYRSLGIDPRSKQVIFSNALDTDRAIALQREAATVCRPSFGIGTHFTNDIPSLHPLNIVIKLVAVKITESWTFWNDTCKLSEDEGKHSGDPAVVSRFLQALHLA